MWTQGCDCLGGRLNLLRTAENRIGWGGCSNGGAARVQESRVGTPHTAGRAFGRGLNISSVTPHSCASCVTRSTLSSCSLPCMILTQCELQIWMDREGVCKIHEKMELKDKCILLQNNVEIHAVLHKTHFHKLFEPPHIWTNFKASLLRCIDYTETYVLAKKIRNKIIGYNKYI